LRRGLRLCDHDGRGDERGREDGGGHFSVTGTFTVSFSPSAPVAMNWS